MDLGSSLRRLLSSPLRRREEEAKEESQRPAQASRRATTVAYQSRRSGSGGSGRSSFLLRSPGRKERERQAREEAQSRSQSRTTSDESTTTSSCTTTTTTKSSPDSTSISTTGIPQRQHRLHAAPSTVSTSHLHLNPHFQFHPRSYSKTTAESVPQAAPPSFHNHPPAYTFSEPSEAPLAADSSRQQHIHPSSADTCITTAALYAPPSPPSTVSSEHPAVVLQQPTPPVQDASASLDSAPTVQVVSVTDETTTTGHLYPDPTRHGGAPVIDILPLESASISEYSLPPPIRPDLTTFTGPNRISFGSGIDIPVFPDPVHAPTTFTVSPSRPIRSPPLLGQVGVQTSPRLYTKMPEQRKIWVKRPGASATLVTITQDDLVDDVRDRILQKYANSLGRTFDSPDLVLRIMCRPDAQKTLPADRLLGPEEEICKVLDSYYPSGQGVSDALIIDIPPKRTPKPSPRHHHSQSNSSYHALEEFRPHESGTDYFPPMPPAPHTVAAGPTAAHDPRGLSGALRLPEHTRSISVLQTGQVPPLPSPGAAGRRQGRPKYGRQHTSSPTIIGHPPNTAATVVVSSPGPNIMQHLQLRPSMRPRHDSSAGDRPAPSAPPLPTPPAPEAPPTGKGNSPPTPLPRDSHRSTKTRKSRKATPTNGAGKGTSPAIQASLLEGSVPPINVLIVEDNIINLKLLEAFMKRLKVRWSTAMNGQIAVNKWRAGGFHLVLMDIQLPIMNGLDATKEIRRLERVNSIGVFSSSTPSTPLPRDASAAANAEDAVAVVKDSSQDKLNMEEGLFKSPVIIVALTASSLQSDRHEALAAGCNDFLTKPVNFVWLERKVKEWGCMQALIDFDGWRKWKDFSANSNDNAAAMAKSPLIDGVNKTDLAAKARERKAKRDKRVSLDVNGTAQPAMLSPNPATTVTSGRRTSAENGANGSVVEEEDN